MKKVPNLRFKEFSGEWESLKISETLKIKHGRDQKKIQVNDGRYPILATGGEIGRTNTPLYDKESVLIGRKGTIDKPMYMNNPFWTVDTLFYSEIKNNMVPKFIFYKFQNIHWRKYCEASGVPSLSASTIEGIKYNIPKLEEQEKIATFFSLIDKKIELQTEKVEELKNYKKGLMQKIFSQELRFKDENGNEYPEWEERTLHQMGCTYTGLSSKTKEDFGFGNGSFVTYMNVFRNTLARQATEQVNISEQENQNLVLKGDLLFTTSSETPNEVGMVSCWNYEMKNLYLNSFCFGYRIYNHDSYLPIFLAYMLRSGEYRKKISILAQGSTRYNISKNELMKMKVLCPCMEEQQKIVALLLNLEFKAEYEQNKLNEFLQYKKGLLQQMLI